MKHVKDSFQLLNTKQASRNQKYNFTPKKYPKKLSTAEPANTDTKLSEMQSSLSRVALVQNRYKESI